VAQVHTQRILLSYDRTRRFACLNETETLALLAFLTLFSLVLDARISRLLRVSQARIIHVSLLSYLTFRSRYSLFVSSKLFDAITLRRLFHLIFVKPKILK